MKALMACLLVGLLALWMEFPSTIAKTLLGCKLSHGNPFYCSIPGIMHRCRHDYDCPQNLRCCNYRCGRSCRMPLPPPPPPPPAPSKHYLLLRQFGCPVDKINMTMYLSEFGCLVNNYPCLSCYTCLVMPWNCQRFPHSCSVPGIHRCSHDRDCPGRQRCCYHNCARGCR
nr:PREDICTED: LOW QUALITY PROTEIN: waprin-Enh1-like [Anolis carolinensis]|eukprot:XP_016848490.1 PREDICTED: LOW QUALITY PROTEIN: waprin-Enh1-like [Anolis carolinensis]